MRLQNDFLQFEASIIFFHCFSEKIRLDVSCESSARQRIHSKHQVLFSSKDKSKKLKCRLLQFLFSALKRYDLNTLVLTANIIHVLIMENLVYISNVLILTVKFNFYAILKHSMVYIEWDVNLVLN